MLKSLDIPTNVRIGTCSWKYDSWQGIVYQDKKYGPFDYLEDYSQLFNTVEIDQWFWSLFPKGVALPDTSTVRRYNDSVPDDFEFSIKAPNSITLTHFYAKQSKGSEGYTNKPNPHFLDSKLLSQFLEKLEPREERLVSAAKIVRTCMDNNRTTYINVNNHYEGSAPLTIQRLLPLI